MGHLGQWQWTRVATHLRLVRTTEWQTNRLGHVFILVSISIIQFNTPGLSCNVAMLVLVPNGRNNPCLSLHVVRVYLMKLWGDNPVNSWLITRAWFGSLMDTASYASWLSLILRSTNRCMQRHRTESGLHFFIWNLQKIWNLQDIVACTRRRSI